MVSARGDTLYNRDLVGSQERIPRQVADSAVSALHSLTGLSPLAPQSFREKATASVKSVVLPQLYPPFVRLVVGEDGSAWVELWPDRNGRRWLGIKRDGKELGLVVLGQNIALKVAAGGRLWAVISDSDGVHGVVRYGIKPAE